MHQTSGCSSASSTTPKPNQLRDHLLRALGQLASFTAFTFVEMATVIEATIREAGFDPDNLPESWGHDPKSRANGGDGAGCYRNIALAFRGGYRKDKHNSRAAPAYTVRGPQPRLWGLTDEGVSLARTLTLAHTVAPAPTVVAPLPPESLPLPRTFAEPLLRALGKLSDHTLKAVPRLDASRRVLVEAGYDPDKLPTGWMDPSSNTQPKIHESLRWLARSMSTWVTMPNRGFWALTEKGLERAAGLNGVILGSQATAPVVPKAKGPNLTSKWLTRHYKGGPNCELTAMMRGALVKHLPLSARRGLIEDHIQNFMVRVIYRDSFAKILETGEELPYSKVASYCVNSGRTDARDMGTEPVCREMMGARTDKERQEVPPPEKYAFPDLAEPAGHMDTDGNIVPAPDEATQSLPFDFETVWKQIEGIVQKRKPGAWERYSNLLLLKAQGLSTKEIADKEGVSRHRAAKMLATVRQMVRESCDGQDLSWAY